MPPSCGAHTQRGKDNGQNKSSAEYQQKVWAEAGIGMFNGQLMVKCKTCGFNTTHSTRYHNRYKKNPSTFKLSASHTYHIKLSKFAAGPLPDQPALPPSAGQSSAGSPSGRVGTLFFINKAQLEQQITAFKCTSTNPSAFDVSEAIRALLLN